MRDIASGILPSSSESANQSSSSIAASRESESSASEETGLFEGWFDGVAAFVSGGSEDSGPEPEKQVRGSRSARVPDATKSDDEGGFFSGLADSFDELLNGSIISDFETQESLPESGPAFTNQAALGSSLLNPLGDNEVSAESAYELDTGELVEEVDELWDDMMSAIGFSDEDEAPLEDDAAELAAVSEREVTDSQRPASTADPQPATRVKNRLSEGETQRQATQNAEEVVKRAEAAAGAERLLSLQPSNQITNKQKEREAALEREKKLKSETKKKLAIRQSEPPKKAPKPAGAIDLSCSEATQIASTGRPASSTLRSLGLNSKWSYTFPVGGKFGKLDRVLRDTWNAPRAYRRGRHKGVDIYVPIGRRVVALTGGTLIALRPGYTKRGLSRPGGHMVFVKDRRGNLWGYAHLKSFARGLKRGAKIKTGQLLGLSGRTGIKYSKPHLHIQMKASDGRYRNLYKLIKQLNTLRLKDRRRARECA